MKLTPPPNTHIACMLKKSLVALCTSNLFNLPYIYSVKVALYALFDMPFILY